MNKEVQEYLDPGRKNLILIYSLFLIGICITISTLLIVGAVLAFSNQHNANPPWHSHYIFALRTFVIGVAGISIGSIMMLTFIGVLFNVIIFVWFLARCIFALQYLLKNYDHPNPLTFGVR